MVARGDLGVKIPISEVPLLQKEFVKKLAIQEKALNHNKLQNKKEIIILKIFLF